MPAMGFAGMELGVPPLLQVPTSRQTPLPPVCCATARRLDDGGSPTRTLLIDDCLMLVAG